MNCDEIRNSIHDYFDNELSPEQIKDFESSVTKCPTEFNYYDKLNKLLTKMRTLPLSFEPEPQILSRITEKLMATKVQTDSTSKVEKKQAAKTISPRRKESDDKLVMERDIRKAVKRKKIIITTIILLLIALTAIYFYNNFIFAEKPWVITLVRGDIKINNIKPNENIISEGDLIWVNLNSQARLNAPRLASLTLNEISSIKVLSMKKQNRIEIINPNLRFISLSNNSRFEFKFRDFNISEYQSGFNFYVNGNDTATIEVFQGRLEINQNKNKVTLVKNYSVTMNENSLSIPVPKNSDSYFKQLANILSKEPNNADALLAIMIKAGKLDVFTLFEIFKKANPTNREMITNKINNFYPFPTNLSKTEVLLLYPEALEKYWTSLYENYSK